MSLFWWVFYGKHLDPAFLGIYQQTMFSKTKSPPVELTAVWCADRLFLVDILTRDGIYISPAAAHQLLCRVSKIIFPMLSIFWLACNGWPWFVGYQFPYFYPRLSGWWFQSCFYFPKYMG